MRYANHLITSIFLSFSAHTAYAAPVDLNNWTAETSNASTNANWTVSPDGQTVFQSLNSNPTFFYSDINAQGLDLSGDIRVTTTSDDDFIGFAFGYQPGDATNPAADFLLVDWKQGAQSLASSDGLPAASQQAGLALSRVRGTPGFNEYWGHEDFVENPTGGVSELARGLTLGNTGWTDGQSYNFRFVFTARNLQVFVDDILEIDATGNFSDGRIAFYNFSQPEVEYNAFVADVATPGDIPTPATSFLLGIGLLGAGVLTQRTRKSA